jgi:diacylglycerol kinase family enzyme
MVRYSPFRRGVEVREPASSSPRADHVLISVNPLAGRRPAGDRADQLAERLGQHGFRVDIFTDLAEVAALADELHAQRRLRALVGVGGDGTAAELVNRTRRGVPITLLAAGTSNLLAKSLGLPRHPDGLGRMIAEGNVLRLDAGSADSRLFLIMVGCGFDAEVVRRVHDRRRKDPKGGHIGYLSYVKPILQTIRTYQYPEIRVHCAVSRDAAPKHQSPIVARWAFASNLPCYGWGLPLAPQAVATDGWLDVCTFRRGSLPSGLLYLAAVQLGAWHTRLADCKRRRARRLRITSEQPVAYQLDGDPGGVLPLDIEVLPGRVTLLVPAEVQRNLLTDTAVGEPADPLAL